ncbi:APC family permease [Serratia sp. L9]|uniref:APC family permease n=1 Tax=Serratia sp. L9 TaxID=3423946 RepID=UPI003D66ADA2
MKQIIGGGVIALTGIVIGMTGGGTPLAYICAAAISTMVAIPYAVMGAAMPVTGGIYAWPSRIFGPRTGFLVFWCFSLTHVALSLYALTAADYIVNFYPELSKNLVALVILTAIYGANLLGAVVSARLGVILTCIMLSGMILFMGYGITRVDLTHFTPLFPNGPFMFASSVALLLFVTGGASCVAELAGEMKTPGKTIPIAIIGSTLLAAVFYAIIASVAIGVLPLEQVAGQPLTVQAKHVMSSPAYLYFAIGAGIISMLGILNVQMLWGSKSFMSACDDGWLPRRLGNVNQKFSTPHWLITLLYLVGVVPVICGIPVGEIAGASGLTGLIAQASSVICSWKIRSDDEVYGKSAFKIPRWLHLSAVVISFILILCMMVMLFNNASIKSMIIMVVWFGMGLLFIKLKSHKKPDNATQPISENM